MRYPTIRYGNPNEMQYYAQGIPIKDLCRRLRRSEKSVTSWLNGTRRVPFWVPELLRLQLMEHEMKLQQMGIYDYKRRIGTVSGDVIQFEAQKPIEHIPDNNEPDSLPIPELRRYA